MKSSDSSSPSLSVVLVAASGAASIARTIWHLRQQSARRLIELVVVVADERDLDSVARDQWEFQAVRVVPVGIIAERGAAAAQGIAHATAPVVALIEDHSFPEAAWAEALLRAHAGPWAGVGPAVANANPTTALSWVNFVLAYGAFSPPQLAGPRAIVPWHNSSYKRELLRPYEHRLGELLSWEGVLQHELSRNGHQLYLEPLAQTHHANVTAFRSTLGLSLQRGRLMGALRVERERWPRWRQWLYAVAFPLYPIMQLRFVLPGLQRQQMSPVMRVKTLCMFAPTLIAMAVGEARGIVCGTGHALRHLEDYELHRLKHISHKERQEILDFARNAGWTDGPPTATGDHRVQSEALLK